MQTLCEAASNINFTTGVYNLTGYAAICGDSLQLCNDLLTNLSADLSLTGRLDYQDIDPRVVTTLQDTKQQLYYNLNV